MGSKNNQLCKKKKVKLFEASERPLLHRTGPQQNPAAEQIGHSSEQLTPPPPLRITEHESLCACCAECVVMAAEDGGDAGSSSITVRLQSKDRDSSQEFSLHRVCSSSSSSSSSSFSFVFVSGCQPTTLCVFVCFRTRPWAPSSPSICPGCPAAPREPSASTSTASR